MRKWICNIQVTQGAGWPAFALFLLAASETRAAIRTWTATGPSSFSVGSYWSGGAPPTGGDTAVFTGSAVGNCTIATATTVGGIIVQPGYTGTIFLNGDLTITGFNADLRGRITGPGAVIAAGSGPITVFLPPDTGLAALQAAPSGGTITLGGPGGSVDSIVHLSGTLNLGSGTAIQVVHFRSAGGALEFGSARLRVRGDLDAGAAGSLSAGTAEIDFNGTAVTQTLIPHPTQSLPAIRHTGPGTLKLLGNGLLAAGFAQSDGILDFNGQDAAVSGDFTVDDGVSGSLANLGGRTLTVGGDAGFYGRSPYSFMLDPGAAWTLSTTGSVFADQATIADCNLTASPGKATRSSDGGGNTGWTFASVYFWNRNDALAASTDVNKAYNWSGLPDGKGFRPPSIGDDDFVSGALNAVWTFLDGDNNAGTGTHFEDASRGRLILDGSGADVWGSVNEFVAVYRATGAGDGRREFIVKVAASSGGKAGLFTANSAANLPAGGFCAVYLFDGTPSFACDASGPIGELETLSAYGSAVSFPVWLRLAKDGANYTGWFRTQGGKAWTQIGTALTPQGQNAAPEVALFHSAKGSPVPTSTAFDDFRAGGNLSGWEDLSFNGTGTSADADAALSAPLAARSADFTGYTGTFSMGTDTLEIHDGNLLFSAGMGLSAGSGQVSFHPTGSFTSTFQPKAGALIGKVYSFAASPAAVQITGAALRAGIVGVESGTWNWGSGGHTHILDSLHAAGGAAIAFNSGAVQIASGGCDLGGATSLSAGSASLAFTGTGGTQWFRPASGQSHPPIVQSGAAGTTVLGYALSAPSLSIGAGTFHLGAGLTHQIGIVTTTGGGLDFGSSTLQAAGDVDLGTLASLAAGTGTLKFTGTSQQVFVPKASAAHPGIIQYGTGGTTVTGNGLYAAGLTLNQGVFNLGSGLTHEVGYLSDGGGGPYGSLDFGSSTLRVTGNASLYSVPTLTPGTGTLEFSGTTGIQAFTPKSGGAVHPAIAHTGASSLTLYGGLTCRSFANAAGTLDFNGNDIATVSSGDFTIANGGPSTLADLAGRTLTVAGDASLAGAAGSGNRLNLAAGAAWYLDVAGSLDASYADLANSNATGSPGACSGCSFQGGNSNWSNAVDWDGGGADGNWTTGANWNSDAAPTAADAVRFNSGSKNAVLDADAACKSIAFAAGYSGTFSFSGRVLTVSDGDADFSGGSGSFSASPGTLAFASPAARFLRPKAGMQFGTVVLSGAGTIRIGSQPLQADSLSIAGGVLDLGAGFKHRVRALAGTGGLDFDSSGLEAEGNVDLAGFASVAVPAADTLFFKGSAPQTYRPRGGVTALSLIQDGSGGTTVEGYGFSVPSLKIVSGTLRLGSGYIHTIDSALAISGGGLDFGSSTLRIAAPDADFSALASLTAGTGALEFTGASPQTFTPKAAAAHPDIRQSGTGGVTVAGNDLATDTLALSAGTFALGSGRTTTASGLALTGGALDFSGGTLKTPAASIDLGPVALSGTASGTLEFTGTGAQSFTPKNGAAAPRLLQSGSGITAVSGHPVSTASLEVTAGAFDLSTLALVAGGITIAGGTLDAEASAIDLNGDLNMSGGRFDWPGAGVFTASGSIAIASSGEVLHHSGTLTLDGNASGKSLDIDDTLYNVTVNGSGGQWSATGHPLRVEGTLALNGGSLALGSGLTHSAGALASNGGGLDFGGGTLRILASDADLSGLASLAAGTGTLEFASPVNTQTLTPKSGATHPLITHPAPGTLAIGAYDLICNGFSQSAGGLDLNGRGITVVNAGNFTIDNGTPSTLANLAGGAITVAGNATFAGTAGSGRLNLDPGSAWTLAVSGSLTAAFVSLANSNATVSAGVCSNCANGGSNGNWSFTTVWDGGGADANWSTAANWGSDAVPTAAEDVAFDGTSSKDVILDANAAVRNLTLYPGYTGDFGFGSATLAIGGDADFRTGGTLTAGSGGLAFTAAAAQTFIPKAGAVFPDLLKSGSGGTLTIGTHPLSAGNVTVASGTLDLETGIILNDLSGGGTLILGAGVKVRARGNVDMSSLGVTLTGGDTLVFIGTAPQSFAPKASLTALHLVQDGSGGATVAGSGFSAPSLKLVSGTFGLGSGLNHSVADLIAAGGGLDFGSSGLSVSGATVDLSGLGGLNPGTGRLIFAGGSAQTFIPKPSAAHPFLEQNGTGGTTVTTSGFAAPGLTLYQGTFDLGAGLAHSAGFLSDGGAGPHGGIDFGSSTLQVTGDADLDAAAPLAAGTGTLAFTGTSGLQNFTPKAGATHPAIAHSGSSTLKLQGTLACNSFSNTAGTLDFNGSDLSTASGGDFTVAGGDASTFANLGGRTLTIAGGASFAGGSGAGRLNLDPATGFTLAVSGTLTANLADLGNAAATVSGGACGNCANKGGNANWTFAVVWDGGGADDNWTTGANWGSDTLPSAEDAVTFDATSARNCVLDADAAVKSLVLSAAYTGEFSFGSHVLSVQGDADFRSGGTLAAGAGKLSFTGTSAQLFHPKTGAVFPEVEQSGAGGTTVTGAELSAASLTVQGGTFHFGSGTGHALGGIATTGGGIDFGTATVTLSSGNADFSGLATLTAAGGRLVFSAANGTQILSPRAGQSHPAVDHTGAGWLRLAGSDLLCAAYRNLAGGFDPDGRDLTAAGAFELYGGAGSTANLGGRTFTAGGNAILRGSPGDPLSLAPTQAWTLAVSGTLTAVHADLANNTASISAGTADSSRDFSGNANWTFLDTVPPAQVAGFQAMRAGDHDIALSWTASASSDADSVMLRYRTDGLYPVNAQDGTLWRSVPNTADRDTATGLADKTGYAFAAFARDSSGNYAPASAGSRDTAWLPDVTPPSNVTGFSAAALNASTASLAWTAPASADADSVMIRFRTDGVYPAGIAEGTLLRTLRADRVSDTATGLSSNVVYHFGLFARDSSGNWSAAAAGARDTSLYQDPVSGSITLRDSMGYTRDSDPALAFSYGGADSLRFAAPADTSFAAWKSARPADSLDLSAGPDGTRRVLAQFKNAFGKISPWYADSTVLDRAPPAMSLDLKAAYGWRDWPGTVAGKAADAGAGTDSVFVIRKRLSDGAYFTGTAWTPSADTAKFRADSSFSLPLPLSALSTGGFEITAFAKDKLGWTSTASSSRFDFTDNRAPEIVSADPPDTVPQNVPVSWRVEMGERDEADSLVTVFANMPAWLKAAETGEAAASGYAARRIYTLAGTPGQADVSAAAVLSIQARDLGGKTVTYSKTFRVADVNDPPVFAAGQDTLTAGERATTRFVPRFSDPDPGDKGVLSLLSAPAWASIQDSAVVLRPGSRDAGRAAVRIAVSDGRLSDTLDLAVEVANVNDAPVAFPGEGCRSPMAWKEDVPDSFTVVVVDMDRNDAVALRASLPPFLAVRSWTDSTGYNRYFRFTAAPAQKDTGAYPLKLRFEDAAGMPAELVLNARVAAVNDTPAALMRSVRTSAGAARAALEVKDDDGDLSGTRFHYRLIGSRGDTLRAGICAGPLLALHPLADGAYTLAVAAEDEGGLRQSGFAAAQLIISGATTITLDSARWDMIAYPGRALPAPALGAGAGIATWDESAGDGSPGGYASGKAADSLVRGKGYWVKPPRRTVLTASPEALLDKPWTLKLARGRQGWNQIGNPYPYSVDLSSTGFTYWGWDPDKRDLTDAKGILKPWGAYWVQVQRDTVLSVAAEPWFPVAAPALARAAAGPAPTVPPGPAPRGTDWSLRLALSAGPYRDESNFLGIRQAAASPRSNEAAARGRVPDAPKFGDYIALHFENPQAGEAGIGGLAADFRPELSGQEEWWDFSVENRGTGLGRAALSLDGLEDLAAGGLYAFVVDRGEARALGAGEPVGLALGDSVAHYSLVVTPRADFASRLKGSFSISQNFPNPAQGLTTFRFFLPHAWGADGRRVAKPYRLRLNVYDFRGRLAATAADGMFVPGSHALAWRPRDRAGSPLAPGAYVYRLEIPGAAKSLKLIVK